MHNSRRELSLFAFLSEGEGGVIERKSGQYLTLSFNYETSNDIKTRHLHDIQVVKRLLNGEIKLAQTPKKLYPAKHYRGRIEIIGKPFNWKS